MAYLGILLKTASQFIKYAHNDQLGLFRIWSIQCHKNSHKYYISVVEQAFKKNAIYFSSSYFYPLNTWRNNNDVIIALCVCLYMTKSF